MTDVGYEASSNLAVRSDAAVTALSAEGEAKDLRDPVDFLSSVLKPSQLGRNEANKSFVIKLVPIGAVTRNR